MEYIILFHQFHIYGTSVDSNQERLNILRATVPILLYLLLLFCVPI